VTPNQRKLARHALGLPNSNHRSYRNRFVAGEGHTDYDEWNVMVTAGDARVARAVKWMGGDDCFSLTFDGAKQATEPRERLDPEDFPVNKESEFPARRV
jgi:hypothetical protein